MSTLSRLAAFSVLAVWCGSALAIDTPRAPSPIVSPAVAGQVPPGTAPGTQSANSWRFKYHNNRWWYWMPDETWVYWSDGRWLAYDSATFPREQPQVASSTTSTNQGYANRGYSNRYYGSRRGDPIYNWNNYNRPVAVPFYGYPGFTPYVGRGGGFRFGVIN